MNNSKSIRSVAAKLLLLLLTMPCLPAAFLFGCSGRAVSDVDPAAASSSKSQLVKREPEGAIAGPRNSFAEDKRSEVLLQAAGMSGVSDGTLTSCTDCSSEPVGTVRNFRAAKGLHDIVYRCGNTDDLIDRVENNSNPEDWTPAEEILLCQAGLLIDLRSTSERHSAKSRGWMALAPGGPFDVQKGQYQQAGPPEQRIALRLDPLAPDRFFRYMEDHWFTPQQKAQTSLFKLVDGASLHNVRMDVLNSKGLVGLNEAILETGRAEFLQALQAMTLHLEQNKEKKPTIVINCVHGKDRTGLLVMVCQSIWGVSDDEIVEDYALSSSEGDSSGIPSVKPGNLDRSVFRGAPKEAMQGTLQYLREKYDTVCPGYVESIGFDEAWRTRLVHALQAAGATTTTAREEEEEDSA